MHETPKKPPISVSFSLSHNNYELITRRCKNWGDRSKMINSILDMYRETDDSREIETIRRICSAFKLELIPVLNNEYRDDLLFVLNKCNEVGVRCNQYLADDILKEMYPDYFRIENEIVPQAIEEPMRGY